MFDFLKRKKVPDTVTTDEPVQNISLLNKLKQGLTKTRANFTKGLANLFLGKKILSESTLTELETVLLSADVGVATTERLIQTLTDQLNRKQLNDVEAAFDTLRREMIAILRPFAIPLTPSKSSKPFVILVVGINGSGKTTTIGKLTHFYKPNYQTLLAAGDTFRAAAIEQLQVWGERNKVPVIAQQSGADTAAVIYDAMAAAKARQVDLLIADTAGRLHVQSNLMAELQKVKRVLGKIDETAPHEVLIVLDATLGQNTINQVKQFHEAVGVTGIALTKLDGTAKGGIIFALVEQMKIPIRFIGIGEGLSDLKPFEAEAFVDALFLD